MTHHKRAFFVIALLLSGCTDLATQPTEPKDPMQAAMETALATGLGRQFMTELPKGGDLHNHLGGAVYAEHFIDWAAADGLCIEPVTPRMVDPGPGTDCDEGLLPASVALTDQTLRDRLIDAMSTRDFVASDTVSGHDDFFGAFENFAVRPARFGDMLAHVARRAAAQNQLYLELMHTLRFGDLLALSNGLNLNGAPRDLEALKAAGFDEQFDEIVDAMASDIDAAMARKDTLLGCDGATPEPGCAVEIRLLSQTLRGWPPHVVYVQLRAGWALIERHRMVVGLNMVMPEDGHIATRDYRLHMQMLAHLRDDIGPRPLSLHAGELAYGMVPPADMRFHIREAIEVAGARRIGHGVSIAFETDAVDLLHLMAAEQIAVEINLTSNDLILGVSGDDHPAALYDAYGVPMVLSTDDAGVSRHDLAGEYLRAAQELGASYAKLKEASRNSLRFSFIEGPALEALSDCDGLLDGQSQPTPACKDALANSPKARLQWELERRLRTFETRWSGESGDGTPQRARK